MILEDILSFSMFIDYVSPLCTKNYAKRCFRLLAGSILNNGSKSSAKYLLLRHLRI